VPRWAILGFGVVILGAIALSWWVSDRVSAEQARQATLVDERETGVSADDLRACLKPRRHDTRSGGGEPGLMSEWAPLKAAPDTVRSQNPARHIQVDIVERGDHRLVRFYTRERRPLRDSERAVLDRCTAP
jgi:hypothetical protein